MRVLGVNSTAGQVYLAIVDDGQPLDWSPYSVPTPALNASPEVIAASVATWRRVVLESEADAIALLLPESRYTASYDELAPRAAAETLLMLAADGAKVECERMSRPKVRSALGLPKTLGLDHRLVEVFPDPGPGSYWKKGRGLAAMVAMALARR